MFVSGCGNMASLSHGHSLLAEGVKRVLTLKRKVYEKLRATVHINYIEE